MMPLSIFPAWESVHPVVNHFAVILLLLTPLFITVAAALRPPKGRPWMMAGLILLATGTASLFVAIPTGHTAAQLAPQHPHVQAEVKAHESLAFEARGIFVLLLILYVAVMLVPKATHQDGRLYSTVLPLTILVLYCAGAVVLLDTARHGGSIAHEIDVHTTAPLDGTAAQP
jgi:uncharacterized membrane protein